MLFVMMRLETFLDDIELVGKAEVMGFRSQSKKHPNGFLGAYVFKTKEDCEEFIHSMSYKDEGFEAFGIEADWESDTTVISGTCKWHTLNVDKEYFPLPKERMLYDD